ncbi:hypothetical protein [Leucobacter sp. W1038]|uniref:hypothetical protein n=1 Tax=Leucobacter sp. W1038 TaxID=3438281 RepID=UPI003D98EF6E
MAANLTEDQVAEILRRSSAGESRAELAEAFGVSVWAIDSVRRGRTRGAQASSSRSLTASQAQEIRDRHTRGATQSELAAEFAVAQQTVSNIVRGKTYRDD